MTSLRPIAIASASLILAGLVNGCSAAPDPQPSASVDQAMTQCGARTCDGDPPPPPPTPKPITSVTGAACSWPVDSCGNYYVRPPAYLKSQGCSYGVSTNGGYIFACPWGTDIPGSLGMINPTQPNCHETTSISTTYCDTCLGPPASGWELVLDYVLCFTPGSCHGPCPLPE